MSEIDRAALCCRISFSFSLDLRYHSDSVLAKSTAVTIKRSARLDYDDCSREIIVDIHQYIAQKRRNGVLQARVFFSVSDFFLPPPIRRSYTTDLQGPPSSTARALICVQIDVTCFFIHSTPFI